MRFRLVPKSMIVADLEWPIRTLAEKMRYEAHQLLSREMIFEVNLFQPM